MGWKYILFDLDGTLTDSNEGILNCVVYALEAAGKEIPDRETLLKFIGPPLVDGFQEITGMTREEAVTATAKYRERYGVIGLFENKPYEGIEQVLSELKKQGKLLALATSKPETYAVRILQHFHLMKYFDVVTSGDEVKNPKPAPDTFLFAAKQLGVPVDECIVIEDSTNGGKAAKAAKMPCIWMHNPDSGDQEIPDTVLEITAWTKENIEKIMKFLHFDQEKVIK